MAFIMRRDYVERVQPGHLHRDYADVGNRWMKRIVGVPGDHIVIKGTRSISTGNPWGVDLGSIVTGNGSAGVTPEIIPEGNTMWRCHTRGRLTLGTMA